MSSTSVESPVVGLQRPRICNVPDYVSSSGAEAIELAARAGLFLDDWQQFVLVNSLGERADGRWASPTVGLVVGRQNGKNSVLEARELAGVFLFGEKTIIHSAHEQATSSEHFLRLLSLIEAVPEFDQRVLKAPKGKGSEAIELRGGYRILFKTRTGGGGRGFSADLIVLDEAMILSAAAKAALIPTMAARTMVETPQTWYSASAVDQLNPKHDGVELSRIRLQGLKGSSRVAYFEWSAEGDDPADVSPDRAADPSTWAKANPGLGLRISTEWVEHERTVELGAREFAVERLGVGDWPDPDLVDRVISMERWLELRDGDSGMVGPVCFAWDVQPDRAKASIGVGGFRPDGLLHVEVLRNDSGTAWVAEALAGLTKRHASVAVMFDNVGAGASLKAEVEAAGVKGLTPMKAGEYAQACGMMFDRVERGTIRHLGTSELADALRSATKRPLGEAWAWDRRSTAIDISSLVAVTLAAYGIQTKPKRAAPRLISLSD
jgi:hypothetical protein